MGSNSQTVPDEVEDDITVFVTGFGPFKRQYPINPSWSIVSSLPSSIPLSGPLFPSSPSSTPTSATVSTRKITILTHPEPVRVSYPTVRALVPQLWDSAPARKIDLMVHVGMAAGRSYYSVERLGHRDGYEIEVKDVDGVSLGDERSGNGAEGNDGGDEGKDVKEGHVGENDGEENEEENKVKEKQKWIWEGCPEVLETSLDIGDVWSRWRNALPNIGVRISNDAGHYLCDFIYYSSLAHLWKREEERRVLFLHVPVESDEISVQRGREVLLELVKSAVASKEMGRYKKGMEWAG